MDPSTCLYSRDREKIFSWRSAHPRASLVSQLVKNLPAMPETLVQFLGREDPWRRDRLPCPVFWPGEFHGLYIFHAVTKNRTQLSNFHFHFQHILGAALLYDNYYYHS